MSRAAVAAVAAWAALVVGAAPADAVLTGVGDQHAAFLDDAAFRTLDIDQTRLVVPWDAAFHDGPWNTWLEKAKSLGLDVQVAFEHDAGSRCPAAPCGALGLTAYRYAVQAFVAEHPEVHEIVPWNEPNDQTQPTFAHPDLAAAYYEAAVEACPSCTVIAGDFLDDATLDRYLRDYQAALTSSPTVWGLHNYYDATYFESDGVLTMLARTSGELWLTETGGIVSFTTPRGPGVPYDEQRAADSVSWLYALAAAHPRIARMYLYEWQSDPTDEFDSALLRADGSERPAYSVVAGEVGLRLGAPPAAAQQGASDPAPPEASPQGQEVPGAPAHRPAPAPRVRVVDSTLRWHGGRRVELALSCFGAGRCRGVVTIRATRLALRRRFDVRGGATRVYRLSASPATLGRLRRMRHPGVRASICRSAGSCQVPQMLRVVLTRDLRVTP